MNNHEKRLKALEAEAGRKGHRGTLLTSGPSRVKVELVDGSRHVVAFGSPEMVELCNHGTLGGVLAVDHQDFTTMPPYVKRGGIPGQN